MAQQWAAEAPIDKHQLKEKVQKEVNKRLRSHASKPTKKQVAFAEAAMSNASQEEEVFQMPHRNIVELTDPNTLRPGVEEQAYLAAIRITSLPMRADKRQLMAQSLHANPDYSRYVAGIVSKLGSVERFAPELRASIAWGITYYNVLKDERTDRNSSTRTADTSSGESGVSSRTPETNPTVSGNVNTSAPSATERSPILEPGRSGVTEL